MTKETTNAGKIGFLQRLQGTLDANAAELSHLEGSRLKFGTLMARVMEIDKQQAALKAARQQAAKELKELLVEALRLGTVLRLAIKAHYGIRAEKVAEFGIQPFRGRPRKEKPEEPAPAPQAKPSNPTTTF
jgi:hypothetical protein